MDTHNTYRLLLFVAFAAVYGPVPVAMADTPPTKLTTQPYTALVARAVGFGFLADGQPSGIGVDIFKALDRVVSFDIKPEVASSEEVGERLLSKQFDLALIFERDPLPPGVEAILPVISVSYIQLSYQPYPTLAALAHAKVGYLGRQTLSPELQNTLTSIQFYDSFSAAYQALANNTIDALIGTRSRMSTGENNRNTQPLSELITRSFLSSGIYVYAREGLLNTEQKSQLKQAIVGLRESNVISQIRLYYMNESAKQ